MCAYKLGKDFLYYIEDGKGEFSKIVLLGAHLKIDVKRTPPPQTAPKEGEFLILANKLI